MFIGLIRAGLRDVVAGGALKAEVLNQAAEAVRVGEYERLIRGAGASPGKLCKIYVFENAFQAILKPISP